VVNAALLVVDRVGIEGLTIRALAAAVGAPPMSLYSHFKNKEALLDLMYAEVAYQLYADAEHPTWQSALEGLCHQVRGVLLQHPRWLPLLSRPALPRAVPLRERILSLMMSAGVPPEDALASMTNASLISIGLTMVELSFQRPRGTSVLADRFERLRRWAEKEPSADQQPTTRAAFAKMRRLDLAHNFSVSVSTFIKGLEARFPLQA
jgi:AcrR family transcriptional regulator